MITEVVTLQGFTPIIACTGEEGYGVLAEHAHTTALIIVGSALPDMDGTSFRQLQLDAPAVASIPTIILSGRRLDDEAAVRRQCGSVGAN